LLTLESLQPDNRTLPQSVYGKVFPNFPLWRPLRALLRLVLAALWIGGCYIASLAASAYALVSAEGAAIAKKKISRTWFLGMRTLMGMRISRIGPMPQSPYFLVVNHHTWCDLFAVMCLCDAAPLLQKEDATLPFVGRLLSGTQPIYTDRTSEDVPRVNAQIADALQTKKNLVLAPEGIVTPGHMIRRFHSALLQPAVETGKAVHYACISYETPPHCPPPSKCILFGPDQFYRTPDGKIPQSEIELWGPERSFFPHLMGLLAMMDIFTPTE